MRGSQKKYSTKLSWQGRKDLNWVRDIEMGI
jgi:hypothetical protein